MSRFSKADEVRTHALGDVATIALPSSFVADDAFTATYWPLDRIGNEAMHRLREHLSEFHFNFKSDPRSTLGGVDYRLWVTVSLFETAAALHAEASGAAAPTEDMGGGARLVPLPENDSDAGLLWIDETRLLRLTLTWRRDRHTPEEARGLLRAAAAGMAIDQEKRAAYFSGVRQFLVSRREAEARNLDGINAYLRAHEMPELRIDGAASHAGTAYLVYRDHGGYAGRRDEEGVVYFEAARYVGEISQAELYGADGHTLDQDALLRAGFPADWRLVKSLDDVPPAAARLIIAGLAKPPTPKPPFPMYLYARLAVNLTLENADPQQLFARLAAARLPSPLPRF